jgi:small subunit ribosomal protein S5
VGEEEKKEESQQELGQVASAKELEGKKSEEVKQAQKEVKKVPETKPARGVRKPVEPEEEEEIEFKDQVISIRRVTKVVKGGKNLSFSALVAVGNENGMVGIGKGKAREVPVAIAKAAQDAKKKMIEVPILDTTIPHFITGIHGGGEVVLRPASKGTGVIAGGAVRIIMELAGIKDILTKSIRSNNPISVAHATIDGLKRLKSPEGVSKIRGKEKDVIWQ